MPFDTAQADCDSKTHALPAGKEREAATNRPFLEEAHGLLVGGLTKEALTGPEHNRVDHQSQFIDQVAHATFRL